MTETKGVREVAITVVAALVFLLFPLTDFAAGSDRSSMDASRAIFPSSPDCRNVSAADGLDLDMQNAPQRWSAGGLACEGGPGPC